jgi:integrase
MRLTTHAVEFGPGFDVPSKAVHRRNRKQGGEKIFTAEEIHQLLNGKTVKAGRKTAKVRGASMQMRAMILLGVNLGYINSDVAALPLSAIDFDKGIIDWERPKNAIDRRGAIWPETATALKAAIKERPKSKSDLVFITVWGNAWMHGKTDSVGLEFGKLLHRLGINGRRNLGFAALRKTFRTVADETLDFPAINLVMGHAQTGIAEKYRERIDDKRLRAIADYVHSWLFSKPRARKAK